MENTSGNMDMMGQPSKDGGAEGEATTLGKIFENIKNTIKNPAKVLLFGALLGFTADGAMAQEKKGTPVNPEDVQKIELSVRSIDTLSDKLIGNFKKLDPNAASFDTYGTTQTVIYNGVTLTKFEQDSHMPLLNMDSKMKDFTFIENGDTIYLSSIIQQKSTPGVNVAPTTTFGCTVEINKNEYDHRISNGSRGMVYGDPKSVLKGIEDFEKKMRELVAQTDH